MKYRPKGFRPPQKMKQGIYTREQMLGMFEFGADAMLEALKKEGHIFKVKEGVKEIRLPVNNGYTGYFLFIPEDE